MIATRSLMFALATLGLFGSSLSTAHAESWIFGQSYYSHAPVNPVQVAQPRLRGGPYYTRPQGEYINAGYRNMRSIININGQTYDQLNVIERWGQVGGQF